MISALDNSTHGIFICPKMKLEKNYSTTQLLLFPQEGNSVKSSANGNNSIAKFSTYIHSRDALWRLLACFPPTMCLIDALDLAQREFTNGRKEVAL